MLEVSVKKRVENFQLDIEFASACKWIGILGASGCGKSMTLRSIAGVEQPNSGRIAADGRVLYDAAAHINVKPKERRVGYLFQNYALFPTMTVKQNIMAGMRCGRQEKQRRAEAFLDKFQLSGHCGKLPSELSGGQQQRVALARMLASEPEVILLDEPFSALDEHLKDRMQQELQELLADYDGQVVLVSHNRDEIYRLCEYLIVMEDGKKISEGETGALFANPGHVAVARMTGCKNIASVQRMGEHCLRVPDWGLALRLAQAVPEHITHIGIRAHDFVPVWGELPEHALPFCVKSTASLPFEQKYFLRAGRQDAPDVCWFVQRETIRLIGERGLPDGLALPEEHVLLLTDGSKMHG